MATDVCCVETFTLYGARWRSACARLHRVRTGAADRADQSPLGPSTLASRASSCPHGRVGGHRVLSRPVCTRRTSISWTSRHRQRADDLGCPLTVHGFVLHDDRSAGAEALEIGRQRGGPGLVVSVEDFNGALPAVTRQVAGHAVARAGRGTLFEETLHPFRRQQHQLRLVADGVLSDGRSFQYHAAVSEELGQPDGAQPGQQQVRIEFRNPAGAAAGRQDGPRRPSAAARSATCVLEAPPMAGPSAHGS